MEDRLLEIFLQTVPGAAALLYIIVFQGREMTKTKEENGKLKEENEKLRLKNEQLYLRVIGYLEGMVKGRGIRNFRTNGNGNDSSSTNPG